MASFDGWTGIRQSQPIPAGLNTCFAELEVVLRLEELHERPLELAVAQVVGDRDRDLRERVNSRVEKCCGDVASGRHEITGQTF
jgi:hypothetical protein